MLSFNNSDLSDEKEEYDISSGESICNQLNVEPSVIYNDILYVVSDILPSEGVS